MTSTALQAYNSIVAYSPLVFGGAGVPVVRNWTKNVYTQFPVLKPFSAEIAVILSVVLNIIAGHFLGVPILESALVGVGASLFSGFWQEISK